MNFRQRNDTEIYGFTCFCGDVENISFRQGNETATEIHA